VTVKLPRLPCRYAALAALMLAQAAAAPGGQQAPQLPRPAFETGVDIVAIDVHVVDKTGAPVAGLDPADFEVEISGRRRRIASAQFVSYAPGASAEAPSPAAPAVPIPPRARRMFIIAVDEHSLRADNAMAAVHAAERFIDGLQPDDLVGLYAYPTGVAHHDLTDDHAAVRAALQHITGLFDEPDSRFNVSPSEAIDIANGDRDALLRVFRRECAQGGCSQNDIRMEAIGLAGFMEMRVSQSVGGLRGLLRGLGGIAGPKILVLISGGLIATDAAGGRVNSGGEIAQLGRDAALADVSVFALHLDWSFLRTVTSKGGLRTSYFRDSNMAATGLELVAGTAGGTVMRVQGTSPDVAFDRVLRETSAHYLLGVEGSDEDRDGQPHPIHVKVKRGGVQVRSRTWLVVPKR